VDCTPRCVAVSFWVVTVPCTTVGATIAAYINGKLTRTPMVMRAGLGLGTFATSVIFVAAIATVAATALPSNSPPPP